MHPCPNCENGYGKRSAILDENGEYEYRMVSRGGNGVKTIQVTEKTGELVAMKDVLQDDELMIITRNGLTIRMGLDEMRVMGRATQGVRLIELRDKDRIASVAKLDSELKEEEDAETTAAPGDLPPGSAPGDAPQGGDEQDGTGTDVEGTGTEQ